MIKVKCKEKEKEQKNKINIQDSILEESKGQIQNPGNMIDEYNPVYEINQIKLDTIINLSLKTGQEQYSDQRSNSVQNENKNDFSVKLEINDEEDLKQTHNSIISNKYLYKHNNDIRSIDNANIPKKLPLDSNEPIGTVQISINNELFQNINSETRELISRYSNNQLQNNIENQIQHNSNIDNEVLEQENNEIQHIQSNNNIISLNQNQQEALVLIRRQQIALNQLVKDRYSSLVFMFLILMVLFFLLLMISKFSMSYVFLVVFLLFIEILAIINNMKTLNAEEL